MPQNTVQIRSEDGRVLTVQRSSVAMYLRRGATEITEAETAVEAEVERLRAEDALVPPTDTEDNTPDAGNNTEEY